MFSEILVCSDGSDSALAAARMAAQIALKFHSAVTLVYAYSMQAAANPMFVAGVWELAVTPEAMSDFQAQALQSLKDHAGAIFDAAGVKYEAVVECGHSVEAITNLAAQRETDLIVVGSRGLSGVAEFLMGSVSEGVLHHSHCSVLIARAGAVGTEEENLNQILLAADASEGARIAEAEAVALAAGFHAALTVLTVTDKPGLLTEAAEAYDETSQQVYTERMADALDADVKKVSDAAGVSTVMRRETGASRADDFADCENGTFRFDCSGQSRVGNVQGSAAGQRFQSSRASRALFRTRGALTQWPRTK